MISVMTNVPAFSAQRHLEQTNNRMHQVIQRLASGSRIIQASDDPAGLAISDSINANVRSLGQAIRNAQDGISLVQVFEGGTNEINNMLIRIRELSMQSASDTVSERERVMLENEVSQLVEEVDRVAKSTRFANKNLLSGEEIEMEFQVGTKNDPKVDRILFDPGDTDLTAGSLGITNVHVEEKEDAQSALDTIDEALNRVNSIRARVGAVQSRLHTTVSAQGIFQENLMAAASRIRDADIASESANLARETILRKSGAAVLTQANQAPLLALQLLNV